jgi:hypothetical protein
MKTAEISKLITEICGVGASSLSKAFEAATGLESHVIIMTWPADTNIGTEEERTTAVGLASTTKDIPLMIRVLEFQLDKLRKRVRQ